MLRTKIHKPTNRQLRELTEEPESVLEPHLEETPAQNHASASEATDDQVRELAYQYWESAGWPSTDGVEFWLRAEQELRPL